MSKFNFHAMPEISPIILDTIKNYINDNSGYGENNEHFKNINFTDHHPFVTLISNDKKNIEEVLPAVSLSMPSDRTGNYEIGHSRQSINVTTELMQEIRNLDIPSNSISNIDTVYNHINALTTNPRRINGYRFQEIYDQKIIIEVWTENDHVKNDLYRLIRSAFVVFGQQFIRCGMDNVIIDGRRDGDYNFDYGRPLYGSMIDVSYQFKDVIIEVDLDIEPISRVNHTASDINT